MLLLLLHVVLLAASVDTVTMMPGPISTNGQQGAPVGDMTSMVVPPSNASISHLELASQVAFSNAFPALGAVIWCCT